MASCSGVVEAVGSKDVEIKRGPKAGSTSKVYSFKIDGEWYKTGFKSMVNKGDNVSFNYTDGAYGKDVQVASLSKLDGGAEPVSAGERMATVASGYGFPMGLRDKGRAINRQNALTNAVAIVTSPVFTFSKGMSLTEAVIKLAREFEAYTTGDLEREAAAKLAEGGEE
jgi:hypothetical protein